MMRTKVGHKVYNYENKVIESLKIPKILRDEFNEFCEKHRIVKSKLLEEFYKTILARNMSSDLEISKGYVTLNVLKEDLKKRPKTILSK